MKKRIQHILLALLFTTFFPLISSAQEVEYKVKFKTNKGSFTVKLYNETPLHRDNFLMLVREGAYKDLLFHRVIKNFMVQAGGDINGDKKDAFEYLKLKHSELIPSEIVYPKYFHKQGALAAARIGDDENPERKSDPIEFYVVVGTCFLESELAPYETEDRGMMPPKVKESYMKIGGSPHLDTQYTVFGEVIEGYNTIEKISKMNTDSNDRPLENVYIISATILK